MKDENSNTTQLTDSELIDKIGGNQVVAKLCAPSKPEVVSGWRRRGIPDGWLAVLKLKCPEVFN